MVEYGEQGTRYEHEPIQECADCPKLKKCRKQDREFGHEKDGSVVYGLWMCHSIREE